MIATLNSVLRLNSAMEFTITFKLLKNLKELTSALTRKFIFEKRFSEPRKMAFTEKFKTSKYVQWQNTDKYYVNG